MEYLRRRWRTMAAIALVALAATAAVLLGATKVPHRISQAQDLGLLLEEQDGGVYVLAVMDHSLARRAGIMPGDLLLRLDEQPLNGIDTLEQALNGRSPRLPLSVALTRLGREMNVIIRFRRDGT